MVVLLGCSSAMLGECSMCYILLYVFQSDEALPREPSRLPLEVPFVRHICTSSSSLTTPRPVYVLLIIPAPHTV